MSVGSGERIAYFNGKYVPEREVLVPFRDRNFKFGDGVFDMTRTFNGRAFKLREHIERLYKSLRAVQIDIGLTPDESAAIWEEVLARNLHLRGEHGDFWVGQRVSRGIDAVGDEGWPYVGPTVIAECLPLPLKARASLFRDGLCLVVPTVRRVPPACLSPRIKSHAIQHLIMAEREVQAWNADAWPILLDVNDHLSESRGANIFLVKDRTLYTPDSRFVLEGISRATVIDLARGLDIPVVEKDLDLYDAYTADEIFVTSTSWCLCPVRSINQVTVGDGQLPGPVTATLTRAYAELVDCDFVAQYLRHLA